MAKFRYPPISVKRGEYYSRDNVAELLGCMPGTVSRYIKYGYLKAVKIGVRLLISSESVRELLEHGTPGIAKAVASKIHPIEGGNNESKALS